MKLKKIWANDRIDGEINLARQRVRDGELWHDVHGEVYHHRPDGNAWINIHKAAQSPVASDSDGEYWAWLELAVSALELAGEIDDVSGEERKPRRDEWNTPPRTMRQLKLKDYEDRG